MADRPLGVSDLLRFAVRHSRGRILPSEEPEHWVWCRAHEQARKNTERCLIKGTQYEYPPDAVCITVGPFMSERETDRLSRRSCGNPRCTVHPGSLGMEVE